jgi:ABC-type transporter Mla subunit MlaD
MARLSAVTYAVLLVVAVGVLYVTSRPDLAGRTEVKAEFQDVYPLLTGMDVREWGAPAGTVSSIDLTDHGTVMVTMALNAGTTPPTANATASIREQDITGDSYVDLSPGQAHCAHRASTIY